MKRHCKYCGKEHGLKRQTCSDKCLHLLRKENQTKRWIQNDKYRKHMSKSKKITTNNVCVICGRKFEGYQKTCSKECLKKLRSNVLKERWKNKEYRNSITKQSKENAIKQWNNIEIRERMVANIRYTMQSEEYKEKVKLVRESDEYRERISKSVKERWHNEEYRKRMSDNAKKNWENDDYRSRVIAGNKKSWTDERRRQNAENLKNNYNSEKHSEKMRNKWKDPAFRLRMKSIKIEMWKNKEYREYMRNMAVQQMADPARRRYVSECSKKMWSDPMHRKHMHDILHIIFSTPEYKLKRSICAKNMWKNELHRENIRKKLLEYWANPVNAERSMNNMFKNSYKDYRMPSGNSIRVQGYEDRALDIIFKTYAESDVFVGVKRIHNEIGKIRYTFNNVTHHYYPDIYIKSINTIIEVKSQWTFAAQKEKNLAKEQACLQQGFNFEFMIL